MPQLPEILRLALDFRERLAVGESTASGQVIEGYSNLFQRLRPQLLRALESAGDGSAEAQFNRARLGTILNQLDAEMTRLASGVREQISGRQASLIGEAGDHARQLHDAALAFKRSQPGAPTGFTAPTWTELAAPQVEELTGVLHARPVAAILREIAPQAVDLVRNEMLGRLANGEQPQQIARALGNVLGQSAARAATVMRTEDMRAYRQTTLQAFKENVSVVKGWRWVASLSSDTCAACIIMHGTEHGLDEGMDSHPNCRCVQVPITASWKELGFPNAEDIDIPIQSGEAWLRSQPKDVQQRALGGAKFDAWKAGDIALGDLRGHKSNKVWGGMNYEVSLATALQKAARRNA